MQLTYTIAMPVPVTHLFQVRLTVQNLNQPAVEFTMPAWAPGSYLIREYARHVQGFSAEDAAGRALSWRKIAKNRWQVASAGVGTVVIRYQVYAGELSVRTSHLDSTHGYFNGFTVFMTLEEARHLPCELTIVPCGDWQIATPLPPVPGKQNCFSADNFDHLIDCPTEIGTHQLVEFQALGKPHRIAFYGHGNEDLARLAADTQAIVEAAGGIFGGLPYDDYLFIIHACDQRRGGLEHRNSSTNGVVRWNFGDDTEYRERVLALLAHEYFHVWNVKRIMPAAFLNFDYDRENYTNLLWVMEGWTSYFELLILRRAGLWSASAVLVETAKRILRLQQTPGRHLQSAEMASFDTWIKFYRPDENSQNTAISYYNKGALLAMLLDLRLRQQSGGRCNLDEVMRRLWTDFALAGRGLPEEDFDRVLTEIAGFSLADFCERYVRGLDELPFAEYLGFAGLNLAFGYSGSAPADAPTAKAGLGLRLEDSGGRALVNTVFADGPCALADVAAGDELLAIAGLRVTTSTLRRRLDDYRPGDAVTLTLFRRDELRQETVTLNVQPHTALHVRPQAEATQEQKTLFEDWLCQPFPAADFTATGEAELESEKQKT